MIWLLKRNSHFLASFPVSQKNLPIFAFPRWSSEMPPPRFWHSLVFPAYDLRSIQMCIIFFFGLPLAQILDSAFARSAWQSWSKQIFNPSIDFRSSAAAACRETNFISIIALLWCSGRAPSPASHQRRGYVLRSLHTHKHTRLGHKHLYSSRSWGLWGWTQMCTARRKVISLRHSRRVVWIGEGKGPTPRKKSTIKSPRNGIMLGRP